MLMHLIYVAHPFLGKSENVQKVEGIIKQLIRVHPNYSFYSPLHAVGFLYNLMDYKSGMKHCFTTLRRCDELWLCHGWEKSVGCNMEVAHAKEYGIPIYIVLSNGAVTSLA